MPKLEFSAPAAPGDYQFELFHDTAAPLFDTTPVGPTTSFAARATDHLVDDLVVSRIDHGPQTLRRTQDHLAGAAGDALAVQLYRRGTVVGDVGGTSVALDEDHLGIVDLSHPFALVSSQVDAVWVVVPRARLGASASALDGAGAGRLHRRSPRGRVLASAVAELWERVGDAPASEAARLAEGIVDVIDTVLSPGDFRPSDPALVTAIRAHVEDHLDDLTLDAAALMRTFHCSRSTLYRLFEDVGGVARHLRTRRLQRCLDELTDPRAVDSTVREVATRWGFENPSHFTRSFTARFGVAPSWVKRRAPDATAVRHDAATSAQIDEFHRWAVRT